MAALVANVAALVVAVAVAVVFAVHALRPNEDPREGWVLHEVDGDTVVYRCIGGAFVAHTADGFTGSYPDWPGCVTP
jgi:hypothetical protein